MGEKVEATKWVLWAIIVIVTITAGGYALRPIDKMVERAVLVNSHQYLEGMNARATTMAAAIAEIDSRLMSGVDDQTRQSLEAQRATLKVQLAAIRR